MNRVLQNNILKRKKNLGTFPIQKKQIHQKGIPKRDSGAQLHRFVTHKGHRHKSSSVSPFNTKHLQARQAQRGVRVSDNARVVRGILVIQFVLDLLSCVKKWNKKSLRFQNPALHLDFLSTPFIRRGKSALWRSWSCGKQQQKKRCQTNCSTFRQCSDYLRMRLNKEPVLRLLGAFSF